jgi:hypothetical protein
MRIRVGKWFPVESISFPRCGHKLTTDLLRTYFGEEFKYQGVCPPAGEFSPGYHFQKNHDFDLETPIQNDRWYIVQVRDPFEAIFSWHKLTVELDGIPDDIHAMREIMFQKQDYWAGFVKKWVASEIPNRVIVHYADLLSNTHETLSRIIRLFGQEPNPVLVKKTLREVPLIARRQPTAFL